MSKRIIKLKESDILKLVKRVLSENQNNNTSQAKLVAFKCYKPGIVQITIGQCGTVDRGCYTFIHPNTTKSLREDFGQGKNETWEVSCEDLKKGIVYNKQGYIIRCPELAKYLVYKSNCCGTSGGDQAGGGQTGGDQAGCTTIRCKIESEIDKCTKKKYTWKEVKKAFEEEFPAGAPSGSSERNQQLWKEWKKGWRPKCKDGSSAGGDQTGDGQTGGRNKGGSQTGGDRPIYAG